MNVSGDQLFAGTAFTANQYGSPRLSRFPNEVVHVLDRHAVTDDLVIAFDLFFEQFVRVAHRFDLFAEADGGNGDFPDRSAVVQVLRVAFPIASSAVKRQETALGARQ